LKGAFRAEEFGILLHELVFHFAELLRSRLAVQLVEERLRIEGLDMARASSHEKKDDRFGLRRTVRRLARERVQKAGARLFLVQNRSQCQASKSAKGIANELAPVPGESEVGASITGHIRMSLS
jgi:hypothetical protein